MNISISIFIGLLLISLLYISILFTRLKTIRKEKPHILPRWPVISAGGVIIIHCIALAILIVTALFPDAVMSQIE